VSGPAAGGRRSGGDRAWWTSAFGPLYREVYAHRDDASAAREAAFAARTLGIDGAARVLDAGCGDGRHARALAGRGARVVGVDRSEALLAAAALRGGGAAFVLADFRALPFRAGGFDHVVSFFTSFGYFDDAGDAAHLASLRRVLRRGGGLLLDFLNAPRVATTLVPESERRCGEHVVVERRAIRRGRVEKDVEVRGAAGVVARWRESVSLHSRERVEAMLGAAGFSVAAAFGDLSGGPWSEAADRLVLTGRAA
jgi:SAM-dependent methyltransferase